ncbi:Glucosylceramide transporter ABCA12 (ATP-binding cassette sub-family A member 12) [Durusdinium trenchii]|uniref:Glucosylceramide transporter ABCA12 (ATP-binding cassette sub-family A member 12) n=1 Tax=Durusdinium trenchii TaxID=1381693 RepID=A0ABP0J0N7_9DINO
MEAQKRRSEGAGGAGGGSDAGGRGGAASAGWWQQFRTQIHRNWLLKSRRWGKTLAELVVPVLLVLALVGIKTTSEDETFEDESFAETAARVPSISELLEFPDFVSPVGSWYYNNFESFLSRGSSNVAVTCDTSDLTLANASLADLCEELKFVVIPEDQNDVAQSSLADDFALFWRARHPLLDTQNRLIDSSVIADNDELNAYIGAQEYGSTSMPRVGLAIVFRSAAPSFSYYLRVNASSGGEEFAENVPIDDERTDDFERGTTSFSDAYLYSGFVSAQQDVDSFLVSQVTGLDVALTASAFPMPTAGFLQNEFWASSADILGLFLLLALLFPVAMIIQQLVGDKESRVRELMFQMGLRPSVYWSSWIVTYFFSFLAVSILLTVVSKQGDLFSFSDSGIIFTYFFLFLTASFSFAVFIASLFERSTLATVVGLLVYFSGFFIYDAVAGPDASASLVALVSLIPSAAFAFGAQTFAEYEGNLIPVTWDNYGRSTQFSYTLESTFNSLFADTILLLFLGLYLDAVLPSGNGAARNKWYFPFTCGYSLANGSSASYATVVGRQEAVEQDAGELVEPVSESLRDLRARGKCVLINGLRKTFKSKTGTGTLVAVDDLSLDMYEGQITCLLGHNGAGKTTTLNMLTGLMPKSNGDAFVYGRSIQGDMARIRQNMGICPQHNVLFPDLTVREHLVIIAGIKGVARGQVKREVKEMIEEVGLVQKTNTPSRNLSGGMKRKLQLAMALIGGSQLVILDEPTSGMDPYSRTFTWKAIERHRAGRTILLTTHFMDEADLLGDRIAIMASGKLQCLGSSLFLKDRFGVGYQVTIENLNKGNAAKRKEIASLVRDIIPGAKLLTEVGTELSMQVPLNASAKFPAMLRALEGARSTLNVQDVGVSVTTLESVFLRVAEGDTTAGGSLGTSSKQLLDLAATPDAGATDLSIDVAPKELRYETTSVMTQIKSLVKKRTRIVKRDKNAWCCQFLIPSIFLVFGFALLNIDIEAEPVPIDFSGATDGWNIEPNIANPIAFNPGEGDSVSAANTSAWMQEFVLPRAVVESDDFGVGPTSPFCESEVSFQSKLLSTTLFLEQLIPGAGALVSSLEPQLRIAADVCDGSGTYETAAQAFSDALFATRSASASSRYGAVLFNVVPALFGDGASVAPLEADYSVVYNFTGIHALPMMLNRANEALARAAVDLQGGSQVPSIEMTSLTLPVTKAEADIIAGISAFTATLAIGIAFSFVPASYVVFVVREKQQQSLQQQFINGIGPIPYWVSNFVFDFGTFLFPMSLSWVLIFAFDLQVFEDNFGLVALIFLLYGLAVTSFAYCVSFFFDQASFAQFIAILINLVGAMVLMVVAYIMFLIPSTADINDTLMYVYRVLPPFAFAHALLRVSNANIVSFVLNSKDRGGDPSNPVQYDLLDLEIAGTDVLFLGLHIVFYTLLLCLLQWRFRNGFVQVNLSWSGIQSMFCGSKQMQRIRDEGHAIEDDDVQAERVKVDEMDEETMRHENALVLKHLNKVYPGTSTTPPKMALKDFSLAIPRPNATDGGQVEALLGVNGAGKSTSFNIVSGQLRPTAGRALVGGYDIVSETSAAQRKFGYCPQFDALFDMLTGREHLEFYGRVKGISEQDLARAVEDKIQEMTLGPHADRLAGGYSGGNKRKLSVAMATIGRPGIVFLDEPSTGMDPVSRRFMWDVISKVSRDSTVLITTHSMEEAEALSTRVGILVDGALTCLGSTQHLKHKYGQGYELEMSLKNPSQADISSMMDEVGIASDSAQLGYDQVKAKVDLANPGFWATGFTWTGSAAPLLQQLSTGSGLVQARALADWICAERSFQAAHRIVLAKFPGTELLERQGVRLRFKVPPQPGAKLADIFEGLEQVRPDIALDGYSLGQTTLEAIFNRFAAKQAAI